MQRSSAKSSAAIERSKLVWIAVLYAVSIAIILFGAAFCVYSVISGMRFAVLQSTVPGYVFGAVVLFLGVRYLFSVARLKKRVYQESSHFSWSNFCPSRDGKAS